MDFKSSKKIDSAPVDKTVDPVQDILEEAIGKVEETKEPKEYTVVVNMLNVREVPNGKVLKTVKSGDILKGTEDKDGWIKLDNGAGYVMSEFVAPKKG